MAWEKRRKSTYYYRSRRIGNKVCRDYMGCGQEAQRSAELDVQRRVQRQAERTGWADFVSRMEEADAALENLSRYCRLLTAAVLLTQGFHSHNGEWRRYRARRHNPAAE
jgi:hypothetical protein